MLRHQRAQSIAEYVIVLGLIVAAVVAMQTYIKRGFQARIKEAVDFVDNAGQTSGVPQFTQGRQYEPYYLSSSFNTERTSNETENLLTAGGVNRATQETSARVGNQIIGATQQPTP